MKNYILALLAGGVFSPIFTVVLGRHSIPAAIIVLLVDLSAFVLYILPDYSLWMMPAKSEMPTENNKTEWAQKGLFAIGWSIAPMVREINYLFS